MAIRQVPPQPVEFSVAKKVSRVDITVPCNINGVNVSDLTTEIQQLKTLITSLTARIVVLERKTASLP